MFTSLINFSWSCFSFEVVSYDKLYKVKKEILLNYICLQDEELKLYNKISPPINYNKYINI